MDEYFDGISSPLFDEKHKVRSPLTSQSPNQSEALCVRTLLKNSTWSQKQQEYMHHYVVISTCRSQNTGYRLRYTPPNPRETVAETFHHRTKKNTFAMQQPHITVPSP